MALTLQTNIKNNVKSFENFSYWLGGADLTSQNLENFTPYIQGISRIFVHKLPYFMRKVYPEHSARFKTFIEAGYTKVDGIGDLSMEFLEYEGGFAGQKFANPSQSKDDTDTITMSVYELSGSPLREYLDLWITGTSDPLSGVTHYHGAIANGTVRYGQINQNAEFIYVAMDPTALEIEYACMFANAFPTKAPKGHLNYEKGSKENVLMDLEFRVSKYESPAINQVGNWYLSASQIQYNYLDFNPNITQNTVTNNSISYG